MFAVICGGALVAQHQRASFWNLLPRNGQVHPLVQKFDGGSMITLGRRRVRFGSTSPRHSTKNQTLTPAQDHFCVSIVLMTTRKSCLSGRKRGSVQHRTPTNSVFDL